MSTRSRPEVGPPRVAVGALPGPTKAFNSGPWVARTYLGYAGLAASGGLLFLVGYAMVASEKVYDEQVPGINLAILGAVLAGAAGLLLLVTGRRTVTRRREAMLTGLTVPAGRVHRAVRAAEVVHPDTLVGGEQLTHYHRSDCVMAAGRDWTPLDRSAHESAGRIPCGVCKP